MTATADILRPLIRPLLATCCVALTACPAARPDSLAGQRPDRLEVRLDAPRGLCPGFSAPLVVTAVRGGQRLITQGAGQGTLSWANYDIEMTGGTVSIRGRVTLSPNPRHSLARPALIRVTSVHHPRVSAQLRIPVRYDCRYVAHFSGREGVARGRPGRRGMDVQGTVSLLERPGGEPLVRVVLRATKGVRGGEYLLEPGKGHLTIDARGGPGGERANGGPGGSVALRVAPTAKAHLSLVDIDNRGGDGGGDGAKGADGPEPKITHGDVFEP